MVQVHGVMDPVPSDSIYFWMYSQGLKHIPIEEVYWALKRAGKDIRKKDEENYWNGWYNSSLYSGVGKTSVFDLCQLEKPIPAKSTNWDDFPESPFSCLPNVDNRWVPCSAANKPIIQWGTKGCMTLTDAKAMSGQVYLAENTKGTSQVIFDCDGDHSADLDLETILFLSKYMDKTHCLMKPKALREYPDGPDSDMPASYHLTFKTNKVIPTMHFPNAHIDLIGNEKNSLRYWKNKKWNGLQPMELTKEIWDDIIGYATRRMNGEQ